MLQGSAVAKSCPRCANCESRPRLLQGLAVAKSCPESGDFRGLRVIRIFQGVREGWAASEVVARFSRRQKPSREWPSVAPRVRASRLATPEGTLFRGTRVVVVGHFCGRRSGLGSSRRPLALVAFLRGRATRGFDRVVRTALWPACAGWASDLRVQAWIDEDDRAADWARAVSVVCMREHDRFAVLVIPWAQRCV